MSKRTALLPLALGCLIGLASCTTDQRTWIHENVPLIGRFFSSAVPSAAPLFDLATQLILGGTTLVGLIAAKYKHSGLPLVNTEWTKVNREYPNEPRKEKIALLHRRKAAKHFKPTPPVP